MTRTVRLVISGVPTVARVSGTGPPLVIVPGLGCASWMYRRVARELSASFTVWRYDHPGHGRSGGTARGISGLAAHLADFLWSAGLQDTPLLGHSLGAEVALEVAARHPELTPALILAAPTGIPENPVVALQLLHLIQDAPRERLALVLMALASYARCGPRCLWALTQDQRRHDTLPNLERTFQPVLVAIGDRDPIVPAVAAVALQALLPDPTLCDIADAAHAVADAQPVGLAAEVQRFLGNLDLI